METGSCSQTQLSISGNLETALNIFMAEKFKNTKCIRVNSRTEEEKGEGLVISQVGQKKGFMMST